MKNNKILKSTAVVGAALLTPTMVNAEEVRSNVEWTVSKFNVWNRTGAEDQGNTLQSFNFDAQGHLRINLAKPVTTGDVIAFTLEEVNVQADIDTPQTEVVNRFVLNDTPLYSDTGIKVGTLKTSGSGYKVQIELPNKITELQNFFVDIKGTYTIERTDKPEGDQSVSQAVKFQVHEGTTTDYTVGRSENDNGRGANDAKLGEVKAETGVKQSVLVEQINEFGGYNVYHKKDGQYSADKGYLAYWNHYTNQDNAINNYIKAGHDITLEQINGNWFEFRSNFKTGDPINIKVVKRTVIKNNDKLYNYEVLGESRIVGRVKELTPGKFVVTVPAIQLESDVNDIRLYISGDNYADMKWHNADIGGTAKYVTTVPTAKTLANPEASKAQHTLGLKLTSTNGTTYSATMPTYETKSAVVSGGTTGEGGETPNYIPTTSTDPDSPTPKQVTTHWLEENTNKVLKEAVTGTIFKDPEEFNDPTYKHVSTVVENMNKVIKYFFALKEGNHVVKYVEEGTNTPLQEDVTLTGTPAQTFTVDKKAFPGYTLVNVEGKETGNFEAETTNTTVLTYHKHQTSYVGPNGPISPTEDGELNPKPIPGYTFVETKEKPNGDREHVYREVTTVWVSNTDEILSPKVNGTQDPMEFDGYTLIDTRTLDTGDTEHVYRKVTTVHLSNDGKVLKAKEDGTLPKEKFPGYTFVETKTLDTGDTEHVYREITTSWVEEDNTDIIPPVNGNKPKDEIPGYTHVKTFIDEEEDVVHVYHKHITTFINKLTNEEVSPKEDGTQVPKDIPGFKFVETKTTDLGDTNHFYLPLKTMYVDEEGNELLPPVNELKQPEVIEHYHLVRTEENKEGNELTHVYRKIDTHFIDEEGNVIEPPVKGNHPNKDIPTYRFVKTEIEENGDITHIYHKIITNFVDENGEEISPVEKGEQPVKDIPTYRFVKTEVAENGDVTHIYRQLITTHIDLEGNEVFPQEKGTQPKKDDKNFRFVETKELENGDVVHVYKQLKTFYRDKDGNDIIPPVPGLQDKPKGLLGWTIITTQIDEEGNIIYVYEKIPVMTQIKQQVQTGDFASIGSMIGLALASSVGLVASKRKK